MILYNCARKSVDISDVEDDWDVEESYGAVQEDQLVDDGSGEVSADFSLKN